MKHILGDADNPLKKYKDPKYFAEFYGKNMKITRKQIKESLSKDAIIVQAVSNIEELERVSNTLVKRLREWYEYYFPEFSKSIQNQEKFTELVLKPRSDLMKEIKIKETIGGEFSKEDIKAVHNLAKAISTLYKLKADQEKYLDDIMKQYCPNMIEVTGTLIGAKLLSHAGSLRHLSELPASTVQILGAEKALFRHLKNNKAKPPKYGILHQHPLVAKAKKKMMGKTARVIADKISIASKIDFFKGKFIGDRLRKEMEVKLR